MRVLLGCEESGVGREAFQIRGHDAWSCDLLAPRLDRQPRYRNHVQKDIVEYLNEWPDGWWDLGIFMPPCTALCLAGNRHYAGTPEREEAVRWTVALWELARRKCKRVAFENPASVIFKHLRERGATVQYVQPWQYGHPETKKTGLALWNLPLLWPTNDVREFMDELPARHRERVFHMTPSETRSRDRSESYRGIMDAMADQWGILA